MQALGFDVIRLAINWSALEPTRGQIDDHYIDRIRKVVKTAAKHGMYTIIDMHSGGWGKAVGTPPGEKCPEGLHPSHGWNGAPAWATFTDGQTTCHDAKTHKRTPAVVAAWDNFWQDRVGLTWSDQEGIKTHLMHDWARLGGAFARQPAVAGFDLFNEPDPGSRPPDLRALVSQYYANTIAGIRASEKAAGGFSHMIFFEPNLTWSQTGLSRNTPSPGFTKDPNIVFAPHLYGRDVHSTSRSLSAVKRDLITQFRRVTHRAHRYGSALWIGEWSFSIFDESALRKLRIHIRLQDSHQLGSAWWQWKVACGAPQTFDGPDSPPLTRVTGNINPVHCPSGTPAPRPPGWKSVIARAYPRAAPGTLTDLHAHGTRLSLAGKSHCGKRMRHSEPKACQLVAWIPMFKHHPLRKPKVHGHRMHRVLMHRVSGGWILKANVGPHYSLATAR
jgi:endoglycosylceramidase